MAVTPTRLYSFTGIGSLEVSINSHAFWLVCWGIILIKLVGKVSLLAWDFDVIVSVSAYVLTLNALFFGEQHHTLYIFFKRVSIEFYIEICDVFNNNCTAQTVFASYSDRAIHFMELPGEIPNR